MANETENHIYVTSSYPDETYIKDGMSTNPITVNGTSIKVIPGDYVKVKNYQKDDPVVSSRINNIEGNVYAWYVYTTNKKWLYAGATLPSIEQPNYIGWLGKNVYDTSGYANHFIDHDENYPDINELIGSSNNTIVSVDWWGDNTIDIGDYDPDFHAYGLGYGEPDRTVPSPLTTQAQIGDFAQVRCSRNGDEEYAYVHYQYPGVWVQNYPDLTVVIPTVTVNSHVQLKWTDPQDIITWEPTPCSWEGTVIVRKENSPPLSRWDGVKVVRSTTRNEYKSTPYKDEDIEDGKVYYYAFMPYYTKVQDPDHPIRYYTFTKVIRVETGVISYAPEILDIVMDQDVATITYAIVRPASGAYESAKLYGKRNSVPACDETDDIIEDVSQSDNSITISDLNYNSTYYFCIQVSSGTDTLTSNIASTATGDVVIPDDYKFIENINTLYIHYTDFVITQEGIGGSWKLSGQIEFLTKDFSFINNDEHLGFSGGTYGGYYKEDYRRNPPMDGGGTTFFYPTTPITITITSTENSATVSYSNYSIISLNDFLTSAIHDPDPIFSTENVLRMRWSSGSECTQSTETIFTPNQTSFANLSEALHYVYKFYSNVNIIVNGNIWINRVT